MLVYLAGPYRAKNGRTVEQHIAAARYVAVTCWKYGVPTICPHLNTANMEHDGVPDQMFLGGDLEMVRRCDAVVMLPNWEESEGARAEKDFADSRGIPVYFWEGSQTVDLLQSETENLRPQQVAGFMDAIMSMYRVHLKKNADYSPANILATGQVGLATRLWDKVARLLNLIGFQIEVLSGEYVGGKEPKNESIDDSLLDLSTYGVIGILLRKGVWGK